MRSARACTSVTRRSTSSAAQRRATAPGLRRRRVLFVCKPDAVPARAEQGTAHFVFSWPDTKKQTRLAGQAAAPHVPTRPFCAVHHQRRGHQKGAALQSNEHARTRLVILSVTTTGLTHIDPSGDAPVHRRRQRRLGTSHCLRLPRLRAREVAPGGLGASSSSSVARASSFLVVRRTTRAHN